MPAHRSITAFRCSADGVPVLSAGPKGASRWSLPASLALHAVILMLVASLHIPPQLPPTVVSVELSFLDAVAEPPSASETAVEMGQEAKPDPLSEEVEQTAETAPQPAAEIPDPVAAAPAEAPAPPGEALPVPVPAEPPQPARPAPRPPPKPVRTRSPTSASPRPSPPDPAADRIMHSVPAQPVRTAASTSNPSPGSAPGSAPGSGPGSGPGSDREAADYFGVVQARLARHKIYPRPARLTRQEGTVLVRFTVISDGTITGWSIVQGSGHDILDQAAEDMIRRASPLPPLPVATGRSQIDITLPVRYTLE
ncbi:energy transducer TonB [Azospirillum sp. 412522]|nr:energy transducer TonB [Azospirillum sp. 412522]MBY6264879.1 energy transducer TonB [Azospirillum sp. 412522]